MNNFNNHFKNKGRALRVTFPGWCSVMVLSKSPIMRRTDEASPALLLLSTGISIGDEEELEALASLALGFGHFAQSLLGECYFMKSSRAAASLPASCCAAGENQGSAAVLHWLLPAGD